MLPLSLLWNAKINISCRRSIIKNNISISLCLGQSVAAKVMMMIIIIIVKPQCGQTDRGSGFGHSLIALSLYSGRARLASKYWRDMKSWNHNIRESGGNILRSVTKPQQSCFWSLSPLTYRILCIINPSLFGSNGDASAELDRWKSCHYLIYTGTLKWGKLLSNFNHVCFTTLWKTHEWIVENGHFHHLLLCS